MSRIGVIYLSVILSCNKFNSLQDNDDELSANHINVQVLHLCFVRNYYFMFFRILKYCLLFTDLELQDRIWRENECAWQRSAALRCLKIEWLRLGLSFLQKNQSPYNFSHIMTSKYRYSFCSWCVYSII